MRLKTTRRATLVAGVAVLVVGTASFGLAAVRGPGGFGDVVATDSHAADIAWLKDNGITMGCGEVDGTVTFCPDDGITRAQMASLLRRLAESGVVDAGSIAGMDLTDLEQHLALAGPQGPQGVVGAIGPNGRRGPIGETGLQGVAGAKGETGLQGAAGATGDTGLQGEPGVKGDTGLQGEKGDTGPAGPAGTGGGLNLYFGEELLGPVVGAGSEGMWFWDAVAVRALRASVHQSEIWWSGADCTGTPYSSTTARVGDMDYIEIGLDDRVESGDRYYEVLAAPLSAALNSKTYEGGACNELSSTYNWSNMLELVATDFVPTVR